MKNSLFRVAAAASVSLMLLTGCPAEETQETGTTGETVATGETPIATGEGAATGETGATGTTAAGGTVDAAAIYSQKCAGCHGANGGGGMGPALGGVEEKGDDHIRNLIVNGSPEKGMPAFGTQLSEAEIAAMVAHVKSL